MSTRWAFDTIENKHNLYCGEDCVKKFCTCSRKQAANIYNFEKKKNATINKKRTNCYICGKRFLKEIANDTYWGAAHSTCDDELFLWYGWLTKGI